MLDTKNPFCHSQTKGEIMYTRPAEWESKKEIWLGWPWDKSLWAENLEKAQDEVLALISLFKEESLVCLAPNESEALKLQKKLSGFSHVRVETMAFGDIWLRDIFPIEVKSPSNNKTLVLPVFNGWGKKYLFPDDLSLSSRFAKKHGENSIKSNFIFEGGAIECDGDETMLTTEQCLLNPNRNPGLTKAAIEQEFLHKFGIKKVVWLKEGLVNDHTDGHIDTIARFVAPQTVAIMVSDDQQDPNFAVLQNIKRQLAYETDAQGRKLKLVELPSCGAVKNADGEIMPASYLNFIIGNHSVAMPTYGIKQDAVAQKTLQKAFALPVRPACARAILSGGGAFHCMSQEFYR